MIEDIVGTHYGDANLDRRFNSGDLVQVFQSGEYEDAVLGNSTWSEGDWDGDGDFTTSDLVLAFTSGSYVAAARPFGNDLAAAVEFLGDQGKKPLRSDSR